LKTKNFNSIIKNSSRYSFGFSESIGRRDTMEDAIVIHGQFRNSPNEDLFCIFDGHGGIEVANHCSIAFPIALEYNLKKRKGDIEEALKESFLEIDQSCYWAKFVGATALVSYISNNILYVANAGDTRCVLCKGNRAIRLSIDHKPNKKSEKERVIAEGGNIVNSRVKGILAITRAIGDHFLGPCITAEPHISITNLVDLDYFLIMACDGLWDVLTDQEAVDYVKRKMRQGILDPHGLSEKLLKKKAFKNGSGDNISVIVIQLNETRLRKNSSRDLKRSQSKKSTKRFFKN